MGDFLAVLGAGDRVAEQEDPGLVAGGGIVQQLTCQPKRVIAALGAIRWIVQDEEIFHGTLEKMTESEAVLTWW